MSTLFKGNNQALISSINALLDLDAKGALAPSGIGEMARDLLETCAARLPAEQHQGEPVPVTPEMLRAAQLKSELGGYVTANWSGAYDVLTELYQVMHAASALHADPGEVERLRKELLRWKGIAETIQVDAAKLSDESIEFMTRAKKAEAEVERLREGITKHWKVVCDQRATIEGLRAQLAALPEKLITAIDREQERLSAEDYLMDSDDCIKVIREAVSASAEPTEGGAQ